MSWPWAVPIRVWRVRYFWYLVRFSFFLRIYYTLLHRVLLTWKSVTKSSQGSITFIFFFFFNIKVSKKSRWRVKAFKESNSKVLFTKTRLSFTWKFTSVQRQTFIYTTKNKRTASRPFGCMATSSVYRLISSIQNVIFRIRKSRTRSPNIVSFVFICFSLFQNCYRLLFRNLKKWIKKNCKSNCCWVG